MSDYLQFTVRIPRPRRRWVQFSMRTMLVGMLIAGLALGWWQDHRRLKARLAEVEQQLYDIRNPKAAWSVEQVLGKPNTAQAGDIATAWAAATQDGQKEWLELTFDRAVTAKAVEIHETYNPGALYKVSAFDAKGNEVVAWTGTDPTPTTKAKGVSTVPLRLAFKTRRIKIYLDSPKVRGWNEIDAVGLRDKRGNVQWAVGAQASSSYGSRTNRGFLVPGGQPFVIRQSRRVPVLETVR